MAILSFVEHDILESHAVNPKTQMLERVKNQNMLAAGFNHEASCPVVSRYKNHQTLSFFRILSKPVPPRLFLKL